MTCVSSVLYRVRVNGELMKSFVPEKAMVGGSTFSVSVPAVCGRFFEFAEERRR